MELKLNVYDNDEIEKTYTTQGHRLRMSACEDLLDIMCDEKIINIEKLTEDEMMGLLPVILRIFRKGREIVPMVFPEMTEDEYDRLDPQELFAFVMGMLGYVFGQLNRASSKNRVGVR